MKAVVTFDLDKMPKNCGDCLLVMDFEITHCIVCMGINDTVPNNANDGIIGMYIDPEDQIEIYERKPDWCPLKELPEKLYRHDLDAKYPEEVKAMVENYQNGFNDCLGEILGTEGRQWTLD